MSLSFLEKDLNHYFTICYAGESPGWHAFACPSDHVGEYWASSTHPNELFLCKNGVMPVQTLGFMQSIVFGNHREPIFYTFD